MLVCPLCRIALGTHDAVCPRDGHLGQEASWNPVPGSLEKRFTLIAPFAHGPTGSTYLADEPETGRRGLLKVMSPAPRAQAAERQRMRRELLKQATMTAAHLALPFATGETENTLWLFREHIEGMPLGTHLASAGALSQSEALLIISQLTMALDDLHRAGLLHRDVKPGHILLARDEAGALRAVLIDSGVCRPLDGAGSSSVFGTPGYVAPEQLAGKLVSFRSDLYALGCVLCEMLTGQPPFARADAAATLAAQVAGELPELPASISPQVVVLVHSLLAKDPQDRPFSAQKLRRALDPFLPHGATVNRHPNASLAKPPIPPPAARVPSMRPPTGRSSLPPPPPARSTSPDATQQLQLEQLIDVVPSMRTPSVAPPTPAAAQRSAASEAARKRDATQPVELHQVLESAPSVDKSVADEPEEHVPSAEHTQQIRLDQILAVADQRKKTLSVPKVQASESPSPLLQAELATAGAPAQAAAQALSSAVVEPAPAAEQAPPSIELNLPETIFEADKAQTAAASPAAPDAGAWVTDDVSEPRADNSVTMLAQRPSADSRGAHATLQGIPHIVPGREAGPVAPGLALDTPQQVDLAMSGDSAQLTLPRDPAAAIAEARRMEARVHQSPPTSTEGIRLPITARGARKLGYAAAAIVLLGMGAARLFRGKEETVAAAPQDQAQEPVASSAPAPREPPPAVMPLAQAPQEPTPTVARIVQVEPQPPAPAEAAAKAPAHVEETPQAAPTKPPAPKAESPRSARRERAPASPNNEELWSKARDEARALYAAKRYHEAAKAYEKASRYNPTNAGTFAGLGGARLLAGDTRGAIQAYQRAVQLSSSTSGFHAALGRAYLTAGDKAKARASYQRALALDPTNAAAKSVLSTL